MNPYSRAIALCVLLLASTNALSKPPRSIELTAIAKDPSVIGKVIRVHACIAVPLNDTPGPEEFVMLYPCGAKADDGPPEGAIVGKFASPDVIQPFGDAHMTFEGEVQADFVGSVARRQLDEGDQEKYFVLTIDRVANPTERALED